MIGCAAKREELYKQGNDIKLKMHKSNTGRRQLFAASEILDLANACMCCYTHLHRITARISVAYQLRQGETLGNRAPQEQRPSLHFALFRHVYASDTLMHLVQREQESTRNNRRLVDILSPFLETTPE